MINYAKTGCDLKRNIGNVVPKDILAYGISENVKVIFGGGRKLGVEVLKWLCSLQWVRIVAVCPIPRELDVDAAEELRQVISDNHLTERTMDEVKEMEFDIGISVNYHRLIPTEILQKCHMGFYNIHHSYNLRLRGRNITTHAILNCQKEGIYYHGTTLHKMVPKLDSGPIVASVACEIEDTDTAYTLFKKVDTLALQLIREWFPRIVLQKVYTYMPPEEGVHYYKNADLPAKEIIEEMLSPKEIYDYVRAFDFPGNEPAYIVKDERKVKLVIYRRDDYEKEIKIKGNTFYTD